MSAVVGLLGLSEQCGSPSFFWMAALYPPHVMAYAFTRSAPQCACCFHPSVSANRRQISSSGEQPGLRPSGRSVHGIGDSVPDFMALRVALILERLSCFSGKFARCGSVACL